MTYAPIVRQVLVAAMTWIPIILLAGLAALVLRFALENHRSSVVEPRRIWRHVGWTAAYGAMFLVLWTAIFSASRGWVLGFRV